jgi:transcriptional pleiotropic regulator of transition state genes
MGVRSTGFVRNLDPAGRIVLPVEWRRTFDVQPGAPLEMIPGSDGSLILKQYVPSHACTFCGQTDNLQHYLGRPVCRSCVCQIGAGACTPPGGQRDNSGTILDG